MTQQQRPIANYRSSPSRDRLASPLPAARPLRSRPATFAPTGPASRFDMDFPDNTTARRNILTATWAGKLMGLAGDGLSAYASDARLIGQDEARLVQRIADDLHRQGLSLAEHDVRSALSRFHRIALHQACATD